MTREEEARVMASLAELDHEDEEFWTDQGLPRVEPLATLAEVPGLTRADITRLAPNFLRGGTLKPNEPEKTSPMLKEQLAAQLRELDEAIAELRTILQDTNLKMRDAVAARDRVIEKLQPPSNARSNQEAIMDHLRSRGEAASREAARRNAAVEQFGLSPRDLARLPMSRLDASMAKPKGFGLSRPKPRSPVA